MPFKSERDGARILKEQQRKTQAIGAGLRQCKGFFTCSTAHLFTELEVGPCVCRAFQTRTGSRDSPLKRVVQPHSRTVTAKSRGIISTAQITYWQWHRVTDPKASAELPAQLPLLRPAKNEALALGELALLIIWRLRSRPRVGQEEDWNARSNEEQTFSTLCTSSTFLKALNTFLISWDTKVSALALYFYSPFFSVFYLYREDGNAHHSWSLHYCTNHGN